MGILASWSWCVVLFLSAYTANLASFLVVKNDAKTQFTSLESAMHRNAQICIEEGQMQQWFKRTYASYKRVRYFPEEVGDGLSLAPHLVNKECDAIIVLNTVWKQDMQNNRQVNPDCNMQLIGEPLFTVVGGFMTDID